MNKNFLALTLALLASVASPAFGAPAGGQSTPPDVDPFMQGRAENKAQDCRTSDMMSIKANFLEAARYGNAKIVKCLVERDPGLLMAIDSDEMNALSWASVKQSQESPEVTQERNKTIDFLLEKAPQLLNFKDKHGSTALAYMAINEYLDGAKKALDLGADMNIKDNYGVTPYGEAKSFDSTAIVDLFNKFAAEKGIAIDQSGIPAPPENKGPDLRPDGQPAPPLPNEGSNSSAPKSTL